MYVCALTGLIFRVYLVPLPLRLLTPESTTNESLYVYPRICGDLFSSFVLRFESVVGWFPRRRPPACSAASCARLKGPPRKRLRNPLRSDAEQLDRKTGARLGRTQMSSPETSQRRQSRSRGIVGVEAHPIRRERVDATSSIGTSVVVVRFDISCWLRVTSVSREGRVTETAKEGSICVGYSRTACDRKRGVTPCNRLSEEKI